MARPRTTSLSDEEMIALGEEMISWLKENPDTIHLSQWYTIHKMFLYEEWKCFIRIDSFRPYYERALKMVGLGYLSKQSDIEPSLKHRWQRVYFQDIKETEDEQSKFEADLKAAALKSEAAAIEQEKQRVIDEVGRSRKEIV